MVIKRSMHLINLHFWAYPNHDVLGSSIDWDTTEDFMYLVPSWDKTVIFQRIFFWHFKFDRDTEAGDFVEHFDYNNHHLNRLAWTSEYTSKFTKKTAVKVKTCILFPNHIPSLQRWIKRWKEYPFENILKRVSTTEGVICRLQVAGCRLQVAGCRCRLQVAGCRSNIDNFNEYK